MVFICDNSLIQVILPNFENKYKIKLIFEFIYFKNKLSKESDISLRLIF